MWAPMSQGTSSRLQLYSLWGTGNDLEVSEANILTIEKPVQTQLLFFWNSELAVMQGGAVQRHVVLTAGTGTDGWHTHQAPVSTCTIRSVGGGMSAPQPWKLLSEKQLVHRCVL